MPPIKAGRSGILEDWQYKELAKTYTLDPEMQKFFKQHNPYALQNTTERLLEAISRGLWETRVRTRKRSKRCYWKRRERSRIRWWRGCTRLRQPKRKN